MKQDVTEVFIQEARRRLVSDYLPKILKCMGNLSEEDVWWRPNEHSNSIGNIVLHLCGNVRQWIIHGVGGAEDKRDRPAEFAERGPIPMQDLIERLENTLQEADRVLADFDRDRILETRTIQGFDENLLTVISHVVEHFAQHLGQISYITKMRRDVDLKYFDL